MKSLTLCLILALSLLFHRGLGATIKGHNEVANPADHLANTNMVESNLEEARQRTKRYSHLSVCRICCNCCKSKDCGICCLT